MHLLKKSSLLLAATLLFFSCKKDASTEVKPFSRDYNESAMQVVTPLVSNIKSVTKNSYTLSALADSAAYYTDRTYSITHIPAILANASLIKTAEDDKAVNSTSALTFNVSQNSTVYIGYDPRGTTLPAWLQGWQKLTDTIGVGDPKISKLVLFSKVYAAGTVTLGGNMAPPAKGAVAQYIVIIRSNVVAPPVVVVPPVVVPPVTTPNSSLALGINGHTIVGAPAYKAVKAVPATEQISMLKQMGMSIYRQDINFKTDGTISNLAVFQELYAAATAKGVTILPMVYTKTLDYNATEAVSYAAGNKLGTAVATKNAQYFKYYELGNEQDNKVLLSGNGDVNNQYDMKKFKVLAAYFKGMNDGIKSVQPGAQTMVDFSWLHYAYYQMLLDYGVKLDIVACHWYSEMEAIKLKAVPDITQKLTELFHKPIWFTEVGERYKPNVSNLEQLQSDFFAQFIAKCKNNPNVKALVFYELFNEPTKTPALEANYGITKWMAPYSDWDYKTAGTTLSNMAK